MTPSYSALHNIITKTLFITNLNEVDHTYVYY